MKRVLKWDIPLDDEWHDIPELIGGWTVAHQRDGFVTIWAETHTQDPSNSPTIRVRVFGTGHHYANGTCLLGSSMDPRGFVWHLIQAAP